MRCSRRPRARAASGAERHQVLSWSRADETMQIRARDLCGHCSQRSGYADCAVRARHAQTV